MRRHYRTADVFVLPTLCEGMALVHLEAMAAGVPVITTPNCGSVVRDGIDGFIVPVRDPDALADRIEQIVSDRALRQRMSEAARERAREYSLSRYAERLLGALSALAN
jgi:glycosyltransferase involved in cell wall biosynthesis